MPKPIPKKEQSRKDIEQTLKTLDQFGEWLKGLDPPDRANFESLMQLSTAPKVIAEMALSGNHKTYVKWAAFGLGVQGRADELQEAINNLGID